MISNTNRYLFNLLIKKQEKYYILKSLFSTNNAKNLNKKPLSEYLIIKKPSDFAVYKQPGSIYDPPYLNKEKPFPSYTVLNLNFISYDYMKIEVFYRYVDSLCKFLNIKVKEAYAMPARAYKIKTYKPNSTTLDQEYNLSKYHRVVRVEELKSIMAPILYESIELNLPEGVEFKATLPTSEEDEFRYIPDVEILELKKKLEEIS